MIFREEVGGRASVTTSEERVLLSVYIVCVRRFLASEETEEQG